MARGAASIISGISGRGILSLESLHSCARPAVEPVASVFEGERQFALFWRKRCEQALNIPLVCLLRTGFVHKARVCSRGTVLPVLRFSHSLCLVCAEALSRGRRAAQAWAQHRGLRTLQPWRCFCKSLLEPVGPQSSKANANSHCSGGSVASMRVTSCETSSNRLPSSTARAAHDTGKVGARGGPA